MLRVVLLSNMKQNSFFAFLFFLGQSIHADPADPERWIPTMPYKGNITVWLGMDGDLKLGCQVVAMGKGSFMARGYAGGLPGDGWNRTMEETVQSLKKDDGSLILRTTSIEAFSKRGVIEVETLDGAKMGVLKKVDRKSPLWEQSLPKGPSFFSKARIPRTSSRAV